MGMCYIRYFLMTCLERNVRILRKKCRSLGNLWEKNWLLHISLGFGTKEFVHLIWIRGPVCSENQR